MIKLKTTFSNGNYVLSDPIPEDAVSIVYGENETIVYTKDDVIPALKLSDDTLRTLELKQAFDDKKSKQESTAYTDFVITDPVAIAITNKYPLKLGIMAKLKSAIGLG